MFQAKVKEAFLIDDGWTFLWPKFTASLFLIFFRTFSNFSIQRQWTNKSVPIYYCILYENKKNSGNWNSKYEFFIHRFTSRKKQSYCIIVQLILNRTLFSITHGGMRLKKNDLFFSNLLQTVSQIVAHERFQSGSYAKCSSNGLSLMFPTRLPSLNNLIKQWNVNPVFFHVK